MPRHPSTGGRTAAALLLLLGLAACSSDAGDPTLSSSPVATPSASSSPSAGPTSSSGVPSGSATSAEPTTTPPSSAASSRTPTRTSSPPTPTAVAITTVRLDLVGRGCDDCGFEAFITVDGRAKSLGHQNWYLDWPVTWTMPTDKTSTLVLRFVDMTNDTVAGLPTVVVMQYEGIAAGTSLTVAEARSQTSASMCWAGTTRSAATITVAVERFVEDRTSSPTGPEELRLVYSRPLAGGSGPYTPTYGGGLGLSGDPVCP